IEDRHQPRHRPPLPRRDRPQHRGQVLVCPGGFHGTRAYHGVDPGRCRDQMSRTSGRTRAGPHRRRRMFVVARLGRIGLLLTDLAASGAILAGSAAGAQPIGEPPGPVLAGIRGPDDPPPKSPPVPLHTSLGVTLPADIPVLDVPLVDLDAIFAEDAADT